MTRRSTDADDIVDQHVGTRIRTRRILLGLSQEKLAENIGKTFQQLQKYERGINRVACSTLVKLATALDVQVSFFFDGLGVTASGPAPDEMEQRRTLELVRHFSALPESQKAAAYRMIKAMGAGARQVAVAAE